MESANKSIGQKKLELQEAGANENENEMGKFAEKKNVQFINWKRRILKDASIESMKELEKINQSRANIGWIYCGRTEQGRANIV